MITYDYIGLLPEEDDIPYDLLLQADPSIKEIQSYFDRSACFVIKLDRTIIGVAVLFAQPNEAVEIKNISVHENFQGKGLGTALLSYLEQYCVKQAYQQLIIKTGNSSIGQLYLYQKNGFEIEEIEKDFFTNNYEEEIIENGIQCKHRIVLVKKIEKIKE